MHRVDFFHGNLLSEHVDAVDWRRFWSVGSSHATFLDGQDLAPVEIGVVVFFILGALFTLQILMPISLPVLMGFLGEVVEPTYSLESYLGFVTTMVVWMGIIFQTPLLVYLIARLGLLTQKQLAGGRRIVWFLSVIFAAVVTPTTDPVTLMLVTGPFIGLYELGLVMARLGQRQKKVSDDEREAELDAL